MSSRIAIYLFITWTSVACQEYAEITLTPAQQKKVSEAISETAPTPQHPMNVVVSDQIRLLGYDLTTRSVKAGESLKITYYFEALADPMGDFNMFFHFQGALNDRRAWMNLDHHPVEGLLPIRKLKKGQFVKDVQTIRVKPDFPTSQAQIYWGLFRGNDRLKVTSAGGAQVTNDGRVVVTKIKVSNPKSPAAKLPIAAAARLRSGEGVVVDGALKEPVWARARATKVWTSPDGRNRPVPKTRAQFAWDDQFLYVAVQSEDQDVWSTFTERDSNTWEQEVIELFIDADGDRKDYLELQVTPANVIFDARFARHRSDLKKARSWNMKGLKSGVTVDGTLNQRSDRDKGYIVEMAVPISEVPGARTPIKVGQKWKINLFRWDQLKGKPQTASAFSPPIVGDFHALDKFGVLRFEGIPSRKTVGASSPSPVLIKVPPKGPNPKRTFLETPANKTAK